MVCCAYSCVGAGVADGVQLGAVWAHPRPPTKSGFDEDALRTLGANPRTKVSKITPITAKFMNFSFDAGCFFITQPIQVALLITIKNNLVTFPTHSWSLLS